MPGQDSMNWRIVTRGKECLACLLNDHVLCKIDCLTCRSNESHCVCGLFVRYSGDSKLQSLGPYYSSVIRELTFIEDK